MKEVTLFHDEFWLLTDFFFLHLFASHKLLLANIYYLLKMDAKVYYTHS